MFPCIAGKNSWLHFQIVLQGCVHSGSSSKSLLSLFLLQIPTGERNVVCVISIDMPVVPKLALCVPSAFKRQKTIKNEVGRNGVGVGASRPSRGSTVDLFLSPRDQKHNYKFHWLQATDDDSVEFHEVSRTPEDLKFRNGGPQDRLRVLCYYCSKCYELGKVHQSNHHPYSDEELQMLQESLHLDGFPFTQSSQKLVKGFGHFAKRLRYDANDQPCSLTVTYVRSMRQQFKKSRGSIWRISIRYDIHRNTLVGVWNDLLKSDQERLKAALEDLAFLRGHPLHLFCAALEVQADFSRERATKIYKKVYRIEKKVGIARGRGWRKDLVEKKFKQYITWCEEIQNRLFYLQKQHRLLAHFEEFLRSLNDELKEIGEGGNPVGEAKKWLGGSNHKKVHECLDNIRYKLCNIDDNIDSSFRRGEASSALLNNLMNYQITDGSNFNSKIGTAIALGTFIFLPATAVSTFFSMSMFDFSGASRHTVSPKFWIFWIVEIPLNIVLFVLLYLYVYRERRKSIKSKKRNKSKPSLILRTRQILSKGWRSRQISNEQSAA